MMKAILISLCILISSCGSMNILEKKVPDPVRKSNQHKEIEKQASYYLASNTKNENQLVANALSRSIGTPKKKETNPNTIESNLFYQNSEYENKRIKLNDELETFAGKKIEGTGINLFPFFSSFGVIALIAVLVLFPSATTILFFVLRRTRTAMANVVEGIQEFSRDDPDHAKKLDELLEKKLDRREKQQLKKF
jgi:hypothetical protein